VGGILDIFFIV